MGEQLAEGIESTRPQPVIVGEDEEPALDDNERSDEDEEGSGGSMAADEDVIGMLEDKTTKFVKASSPFAPAAPSRPPRVPLRKMIAQPAIPEASLLNPGVNVIPEASLLKRGLVTPPGVEKRAANRDEPLSALPDRRTKEEAPSLPAPKNDRSLTVPERQDHLPVQAPSQPQSQSQAKRRVEKGFKEAPADAGRKGKVSTPLQPKVTAADLAPMDHGMTLLEVLQLLSEVLSPSSLLQISWETKQGLITLEPTSWQQDNIQPIAESLSVLEYLETEIVFPEFVRLLVRMADLGTRNDPNLCKRSSFADRVEGFLRFVFLPAVRTPYISPATATAAIIGARKMSSSSDGAKSKQGDSSQGAGGGEPAKSPEDAAAAEGADGMQEADAEKPPVQVPMPEPKFWRGYEFTGPPGTDAPRRWPKSYQTDFMDWE